CDPAGAGRPDIFKPRRADGLRRLRTCLAAAPALSIGRDNRERRQQQRARNSSDLVPLMSGFGHVISPGTVERTDPSKNRRNRTVLSRCRSAALAFLQIGFERVAHFEAALLGLSDGLLRLIEATGEHVDNGEVVVRLAEAGIDADGFEVLALCFSEFSEPEESAADCHRQSRRYLGQRSCGERQLGLELANPDALALEI